MPIVITPGQKIKKSKKETIKGRPVKPPKSAYVQYLNQLLSQLSELEGLASNVPAFVALGMPEDDILERLTYEHAQLTKALETRANKYSNSFVQSVSNTQKTRLERTLSKSLGVDVLRILETEEIQAAYELAVKENVDLIRTLGSEYFGEIRTAIKDNFAGIELPEGRTLRQQIQAIGNNSDERARLIARDQTNKITTDFNRLRQESVGIRRYIWQTSGDQRVVGTPGGLYPKGSSKHMNHYQRNGKIFEWNDPPPDGHPGQAIRCRCVAQPLIDRDTLEIL